MDLDKLKFNGILNSPKSWGGERGKTATYEKPLPLYVTLGAGIVVILAVVFIYITNGSVGICLGDQECVKKLQPQIGTIDREVCLEGMGEWTTESLLGFKLREFCSGYVKQDWSCLEWKNETKEILVSESTIESQYEYEESIKGFVDNFIIQHPEMILSFREYISNGKIISREIYAVKESSVCLREGFNCREEIQNVSMEYSVMGSTIGAGFWTTDCMTKEEAEKALVEHEGAFQIDYQKWTCGGRIITLNKTVCEQERDV